MLSKAMWPSEIRVALVSIVALPLATLMGGHAGVFSLMLLSCSISSFSMVGTILFSTGTDQMLRFLHAAPAMADVTQSTENILEYGIPKV